MKTSVTSAAEVEARAVSPTQLTESETDHVAGGAGHAYGKLAKEQDEPAWRINGGRAKDAPGHNK